MDLWYSEKHTEHVKLSIAVDKQLYSGQSEFQRIDVFESKEFGRFLTLDGYMMLTERDEFIYHEMITHVPMAVHPDVKQVLIIGAGGVGQTDAGEEGFRLLHAQVPGQVAQAFADLVAGAHDGVEAGGGVLEDVCQPAAAVAAQFFFGEGQQVGAVEEDAAGDFGGAGGGQAGEGERGEAFAAAAFADECDAFAGADVEGD